MADAHEFPGLEAVARQAIEAAEATLPPDVRVALLLAFHRDALPGGFAWVAGITRESAISLVCEWLAKQAHDGHGELIAEAFRRFLDDPDATFDPHAGSP